MTSKSQNAQAIPSMQHPSVYRIRVNGGLDQSWSERLAGMTITTTCGRNTADSTKLEGQLLDQAALTGILNTLYDLQLPLVSVECLDCTNSENEHGRE